LDDSRKNIENRNLTFVGVGEYKTKYKIEIAVNPQARRLPVLIIAFVA